MCGPLSSADHPSHLLRLHVEPPIEWCLVIRVRSRWMPTVVGLASGLLSLAWAWGPSYWSDEAATVRAASLSPAELVAFVQHKDAVHAVYYLSVGAWSRVVGSSELALRAPSAIAVAVAASALVCVFRRFERLGTGVVAGVVFAVLPRTTYMGVEARSYAVATALTTLIVLFAIRTMMRGRLRDAVVLALIAAAGTAVFIYSALVVVAVIAYMVFIAATQALRRRAWPVRAYVMATGALLVGVGVAAPLVVIVAGQKSQIAWLGSQPVVNLWTVLAEPWAESSAAVAVVGALLLLAAVWRRRVVLERAGGPLVALLLCWTFVPGVVLLAVNAVDGPLYTSRYLSFVTPGLAGLLAIGLRFALNRRLRVAALLLLLLAAAPTYVTQRTATAKAGADLRQVADYIAEHSRPGDGFVFEKARTVALDPRQAIAAYPDRFARLRDIALVQQFPATGTFSDATRRLDSTLLVSASERVWLIAPAAMGCEQSQDATALQKAGYQRVRRHVAGRDGICEFLRPR